MIIAIDGPAASGKGTIARQIASVYGLHHLDTGLLYRAVAKAMLDAGYPPDDAKHATEVAAKLDPSQYEENALKLQPITEAASVVAAIPQVRQALINYQREFATRPPGAVLDGRDIGTVIAPGADVKLFVVASPEVRAERRWLEHRQKGDQIDLQHTLEEVIVRDRRDREREASPLVRAADAVFVDSTAMDGEEVARLIELLADQRRAEYPPIALDQ